MSGTLHSLFYFHLNIISRRQVLLLSPLYRQGAWGPKNAKHTLYKGLHCFFPIIKLVFGSTQDRHMGVTLLPLQQRGGLLSNDIKPKNCDTWTNGGRESLRNTGAEKTGPSLQCRWMPAHGKAPLRGTRKRGADWSTTGASLSRGDDS